MIILKVAIVAATLVVHHLRHIAGVFEFPPRSRFFLIDPAACLILLAWGGGALSIAPKAKRTARAMSTSRT